MPFCSLKFKFNMSTSGILEKSGPEEEKKEERGYMDIRGKPRYADLKSSNITLNSIYLY